MTKDMGTVLPLVGRTSGPELLTVAEAAEVMRVSTDLLYDLIRGGQFPAIKLRGRFVIPLRALLQLEADALRAGSVVDVAGWTSEWSGRQDGRRQACACGAGSEGVAS